MTGHTHPAGVLPARSSRDSRPVAGCPPDTSRIQWGISNSLVLAQGDRAGGCQHPRSLLCPWVSLGQLERAAWGEHLGGTGVSPPVSTHRDTRPPAGLPPIKQAPRGPSLALPHRAGAEAQQWPPPPDAERGQVLQGPWAKAAPQHLGRGCRCWRKGRGQPWSQEAATVFQNLRPPAAP